MSKPAVVVLFSGKRKCGKDFLAEKLHKTIGEEKCTIIRISEPIKRHWAEKNNLNLSQLMSCADYKEKYRKAMVEWSEQMRNRDPGCFCHTACEKAPLKEVWIVSDVRRKTDVEWFKEMYGERVKTVRIATAESVRKNRGWEFTEGIDDVDSECGLDDYEEWDLILANNNEEDGNLVIEKILELVKHSICS